MVSSKYWEEGRPHAPNTHASTDGVGMMGPVTSRRSVTLRLRFGGLVLLSVVAACGGISPSPIDDGEPPVPDSGGCVLTPRAADPCVPGQVACDKVISACCSPTYACNPKTKKWEQLQAGCICKTVSCGPKDCLGSQICVTHIEPGSDVSYSCEDYPTSCERHQVCSCLSWYPPAGCLAKGVGTCDEASTGIRVTCSSN